MKEKDKNNSAGILRQKSPWNHNENSIWIASTVNFYRNVEKFNFPGKLASDRKKQIISLISKELVGSKQLQNAQLYKGEDLSHIEKEYLVEHFLTFQSFQQAHSGEGFILDDSGEFLVSLNMRDHLHFLLVDTSGDIENCWNRLEKIETELGKTISYSFSPKFGFLTADPNECGTGLLVYNFLQIPALVHSEKIVEFLEKQNDEMISLTGLQGNPHELIGDLLVVHNNFTLGLTEDTILSSLRTYITKLIVEEKSARSQIKKENNSAIKDKISRAYGILMHSYQIEAAEALNALSLIKLGVDLGWLTGLTTMQLNELMIKCRRAHLLCEYDQKLQQEEVTHKRSEYIHEALKSLALHL